MKLPSTILAGLLALPPSFTAATAAPDADAPDETAEGEDGGEGEGLSADAERAREAYVRGTQLYQDADFEAALEAFQEAATYYASPDFQFNIARCYERLGNYEEAIRHYEIYLRTSEDSMDRAVVEASIEDLRERIAEREAAEQAEAERLAAEAERKPSKPLILSGAALLGVGAAVGLGGGIGFGVMVARDNAALGDVANGNPEGLSFAEAETLADQARANQTLELAMIGAGSALAITGAVLLAVGLKRKRDAEAGEQAPPASAQTWRLSPYAAPTANGLSAGLHFGGQF